MRVYVAGPYTNGDVAVNVRAAMEVGLRLIGAGHAPYVPHLSHFMHMLKPQSYDTWLQVDRAWLLQCNAMIRIPGNSNGADLEVQLANKAGIPVFSSYYDFVSELGMGKEVPSGLLDKDDWNRWYKTGFSATAP